MLRKFPVSKTVLLAAVAAAIVALPVMSVSASTTYTTVNANWTGGGGDWTDGADWSSNPNYADNGTPADTVYNATITSGGVYLDTSVNVDNLTLGAADQIFTIGAGGILNLSQPDNSGASGTLAIDSGTTMAIMLSGGTIENATVDVLQNSDYVTGAIWMPSSGSGTLKNVTLASDLVVNGYLYPDLDVATPLNIVNSASSAQGINLNGHTLQLLGMPINFQDATTPGGADVGEVIDNGTVEMAGVLNATGSLTIGSNATLRGSVNGGNIAGPEFVITGKGVTNDGNIEVTDRLNVSPVTPGEPALMVPLFITVPPVIEFFPPDPAKPLITAVLVSARVPVPPLTTHELSPMRLTVPSKLSFAAVLNSSKYTPTPTLTEWPSASRPGWPVVKSLVTSMRPCTVRSERKLTFCK